MYQSRTVGKQGPDTYMRCVNEFREVLMSDSHEKSETELPPAAKRALAEAEERRRQREADDAAQQAREQEETGGPKGKEPTRYGDWERKGIAYDF